MTTIGMRDTLNENGRYTFTFESGKILWQPSAGSVQQDLAYYLQNFGTVVNVDRGFFSSRYQITVTASAAYLLSDWLDEFSNAWQNMGWDAAQFIQCEAGDVSSQPGGIKQEVIQDVTGIADTVSQAAAGGAGSILKNLAPYIIIVAGGALLFLYAKKKASQ